MVFRQAAAVACSAMVPGCVQAYRGRIARGVLVAAAYVALSYAVAVVLDKADMDAYVRHRNAGWVLLGVLAGLDGVFLVPEDASTPPGRRWLRGGFFALAYVVLMLAGPQLLVGCFLR